MRNPFIFNCDFAVWVSWSLNYILKKLIVEGVCGLFIQMETALSKGEMLATYKSTKTFWLDDAF